MPLEIRGALFNSECTISAGNTLRIGPGKSVGKMPPSGHARTHAHTDGQVDNAMPRRPMRGTKYLIGGTAFYEQGRGQLYTEPYVRSICCHVTSPPWQEPEEELNNFF